jgi:hypothetical protein
MPTKTGLLQVGDRISDPLGSVFIVTQRLGNSLDYSVRIKREDGKPFTGGEAHGKMERLLLTPSWKLKHGWAVLE